MAALFVDLPLNTLSIKQQHEIDTAYRSIVGPAGPDTEGPYSATNASIDWVPYDEEKRFDKLAARECLTNRTVLVLGNSVARHWYFSARHKLGDNVCSTEGRKCEKTLCGTGGAAGGARPGQGGCARTCGCDITVGAGTHLHFIWQQRIFDLQLRDVIDEVNPDLIVMNAGGDDIFAEHSREVFRERAREQAPMLRDMLDDLLNNRQDKKPIEVYWRTTTAVCKNRPHFGVDDVSTLNPLIVESNEYIAAQLSGVPRLRFLDGYGWTAGKCDRYDDDIHHSTMVYAHFNTLLRDYCLPHGSSREAGRVGEAPHSVKTGAVKAVRSHAKQSAGASRSERIFEGPYWPGDYIED